MSPTSKNVWVPVLALLISALIAELILRSVYPPAIKTYPCADEGHPAYTVKQCPTSQDRINTMHFSGDLLYSPEANSAGQGWSTDQHGFRSNGPTQAAQDPSRANIRIAVTGGSTAWGVGVADAQTFPAALQQLLQARCQRNNITVWNAAISAQTSGQERRRFETDVLPLKPHIHIALTGFNDIYNSYTGLLPHQNRDYFEVGKRFGAQGVNDFIAQAPTPQDHALRILYLMNLVHFKWTHDPTHMARAIERRTAETAQTVDSSLRTTKIFTHWAKDYGHEFYYVLQPSIYFTRKKLTHDELAIRKSDADFGNFHNQGYAALKRALERAGEQWPMNFLDADLAIAKEESDLFIDNVHFGDRGYRMLAEAMSSHLIQTSATLKRHCGAQR